MKLTDCKPGMSVWWLQSPTRCVDCVVLRATPKRVEVEYSVKGRVTYRALVMPKNLYPRTI